MNGQTAGYPQANPQIVKQQARDGPSRITLQCVPQQGVRATATSPLLSRHDKKADDDMFMRTGIGGLCLMYAVIPSAGTELSYSGWRRKERGSNRAPFPAAPQHCLQYFWPEHS